VVFARRWSYALITLLILSLFAQPMWAHAILMESTPKLNSTIKGPDVEVMLRYNVRIDGVRSRVQLVQPDGSAIPLTLAKQQKTDVLQCKATGLKPGAYKLKWNVLASDGHMSKGEVPFTVQ
jgi:methionine-rich copper-binding protein CopC